MANIRIEDRDKIIKIPLIYSDIVLRLEKEVRVVCSGVGLSNLCVRGNQTGLLKYEKGVVLRQKRFKVIGKNRKHLILKILICLLYSAYNNNKRTKHLLGWGNNLPCSKNNISILLLHPIRNRKQKKEQLRSKNADTEKNHNKSRK
jgi:hypothetical protein